MRNTDYPGWYIRFQIRSGGYPGYPSLWKQWQLYNHYRDNLSRSMDIAVEEVLKRGKAPETNLDDEFLHEVEIPEPPLMSWDDIYSRHILVYTHPRYFDLRFEMLLASLAQVVGKKPFYERFEPNFRGYRADSVAVARILKSWSGVGEDMGVVPDTSTDWSLPQPAPHDNEEWVRQQSNRIWYDVGRRANLIVDYDLANGGKTPDRLFMQVCLFNQYQWLHPWERLEYGQFATTSGVTSPAWSGWDFVLGHRQQAATTQYIPIHTGKQGSVNQFDTPGSFYEKVRPLGRYHPDTALDYFLADIWCQLYYQPWLELQPKKRGLLRREPGIPDGQIKVEALAFVGLVMQMHRFSTDVHQRYIEEWQVVQAEREGSTERVAGAATDFWGKYGSEVDEAWRERR